MCEDECVQIENGGAEGELPAQTRRELILILQTRRSGSQRFRLHCYLDVNGCNEDFIKSSCSQESCLVLAQSALPQLGITGIFDDYKFYGSFWL